MKALIQVTHVRDNGSRSISVVVPGGLSGRQLANWRCNAANDLVALPVGEQSPPVEITASVDADAVEGDRFERS
jgi:hypothetical protein